MRKIIVGGCIAGLGALCLLIAARTGCLERMPVQPAGRLVLEAGGTPESGAWLLGDFQIIWDTAHGGSLRVMHRERPADPVWASAPGAAFLMAAEGRERVHEARGSFFIRDKILRRCADQTLASIQQQDDVLRITGALRNAASTALTPYVLEFRAVTPARLSFSASVEAPYNRLYWTYVSDAAEQFHGFGAQFSHFNMKGRRLPVFIMEQGIGRGAQPLTFLVDLAARSGGRWHTTYAAAPHYISSRMRSLFLDNHEYAVFDMRAAERMQIEVFSNHIGGSILHGATPPDLIAAYTEAAGRMRALPDWILEGAVAGMQGGTARVRAVWAQLQAERTPVAAFWLQDWVGQRKTRLGKQLWWNWELDQDHYPDWEPLRGELARAGVRIMTYVNPFLADVSAKPNHRSNYFVEARDRGFLARAPSGEPALILNTDFTAGLADLSNPEAWAWLKSVIREEVLGAGASGWMADFGEALPSDAMLHSGESAATAHNRYPEWWARLNREVIEESGAGDEYVFFMRSGFRESPRYATLFWLGDQMVTWDEHDGIKSAVTGLLSSGLSGFAFNHSDIGGYTSVRMPFLRYRRSRELLYRWMELNAFSVIFRTHEGIDPEANVQFFSDEGTLRQFSRMAKVYAAWTPLRKRLVREAAETGLPVVRHPFIHYPDDPHLAGMQYEQFLVGDVFMVAPVLDPGVDTVVVRLPAGRWVHAWSGAIHESPGAAAAIRVAAPIGMPAVFYREGCPDGAAFTEALRTAGLL